MPRSRFAPSALHLFWLKLRTHLFGHHSLISPSARFDLSLIRDPAGVSPLDSFVKQAGTARALASSSDARQMLLEHTLTNPDAQAIAIQKLDNLEDLDSVLRAGVVVYPATMALDVQRQKLRKENQTLNV